MGIGGAMATAKMSGGITGWLGIIVAASLACVIAYTTRLPSDARLPLSDGQYAAHYVGMWLLGVSARVILGSTDLSPQVSKSQTSTDLASTVDSDLHQKFTD